MHINTVCKFEIKTLNIDEVMLKCLSTDRRMAVMNPVYPSFYFIVGVEVPSVFDSQN